MPAQRLLPFLLALVGCSLCGCASTDTVKRPYPQIESALLQRLDTTEKKRDADVFNAWIGSQELVKCLRVRSVQISHYTPGQRIRLRTRETYDIGAIGHNELTVDLQRVDDRRTRISVDYSDRAIGFLVIPFAYASPGWVRERKIANCLARLEGAPSEADRIPRPPPIQQPPPIQRPPPPAYPCEQMQGRSCGPPGAVVRCDAAGGQRIRCRCTGKGVLDCGR